MSKTNGEHLQWRQVEDQSSADVILSELADLGLYKSDGGHQATVGRPVPPVHTVVGVPTSEASPVEGYGSQDSHVSTDLPTMTAETYDKEPESYVVTSVGGEPLFADEDSDGIDIGDSQTKTDDVEPPRRNRRMGIIVGVAGASVLATALGAGFIIKSDRMSPEEKAHIQKPVPAAAASADPVKQHHHKPKPSQAASQSPSAAPTNTTPAVPAAPETLPAPTTPPIPTGATSFRIGSLDFDNNDNWEESLAKSYNVVNKHLDIVGLRDVREDPWHRMQAADMFGKDHGIFPTEYDDFASHDPVLWDSTLLDLVEGQTLSGTHGSDTESHPNAITVVRLKSKQTSEEFYVLNTTLPDGKTIDAYQARKDATTNLVEIVNNIKSHEQVQVFLLADMSDRVGPHDVMNGHYINRELTSNPFCTLSGLGQLANAFTLDRSGAPARECVRDPRMPADQVWMTGVDDGSVIFVDYINKIGPKRNGTEDNTLVEVAVTTAGKTDPITAETGAS